MDETDTQIISQLRHNARSSVSDIAAGLGMTRSTVRARIERMQTRGDIIGYSVVLKSDVQTHAVRGLMMIEIEGRGTDRVVRHLQGMQSITALHSTNGRWDVIVEIGTDTLEAFDKVLTSIRKIDGVVASETSLLLSTRKKS